MSNSRELKPKLAAISRLWGDEKYDQALAEVESLLKTWPGNAHLHVLWASLVQLQEEPSHDLQEARRALERAVDLDKDSPAATIELGHFLDNVEDNPRAAVKTFAAGVASARRLLIEGLLGQAKAYRQLEKRTEFWDCVWEVIRLAGIGNGSKDRLGADAILEGPMGRLIALQMKGPAAREVEEALEELFASPLN